MNKRLFLVITDIESTFEEYTKSDFSNISGDQFKEFLKFVNDFEKQFNCEIRIHFVSGVGKTEIRQHLNKFSHSHPNSNFPKIGECVIEGGFVVNRFGQIIDRCDTDKAVYSKADGVFYICQQYGSDVFGACFMGDAKEDIPGFKMIKEMRYPLGSYALCARSQRDFGAVEGYVDFISQKPRIHGCCECLNKMKEIISKKLNFQK